MISEVPIIWLLSLCSMGSIVAIVFGCVCGCRKKVPKNELMGLAGMVKLTNPEATISYNSTIVDSVQVDPNSATAADGGAHFHHHTDMNKRPTTATATATRSLPDLPVEPGMSAWDHNDTSSDLYATVDENKDKRRCVMQGQSGDDGYNSPTQTDDSLSPYARVKGEHPYDQLKQSEHPYAQVHANGVAGGSIAKHNNSAIPSASSQPPEHSVSSPTAPPRMRKSLALSDSSSRDSLPPPHDSIPAASAIAGSIAASQELPYMTPPLVLSAASTAAPSASNQQHFSGDSQDSSKGYTSISVREPLSTILGERSRSQRQDLIDSHYMTVSDDSDEMYAAIEEPGQAVYTSGSETYARIRPNPLPQTRPPPAPVPPEDRDRDRELERPPSQQARRMSHSRQASSSSAASSGGMSPNSPKPEKRQANSPLPRPPPEPLLGPPAPPAAVDDMYAKVMKKRRSSQSVASLEEAALSSGDMLANAARTSSGYERLSHDILANAPSSGYERLASPPTSSAAEPNYEELKPHDPLPSAIESNYAKVNKTRTKNNNNNNLKPTVEPAYASLSSAEVDGGNQDPDYESVSATSQHDPNYESLEKTDSENDPPYEKLHSTSSASIDDDYETVFRVEGRERHT
ncbi:actin cytoskeleton-regulatory complex protein pan1 isoform X2 [Nilaparvata lugens]|uniref:actin cytoskeleton-regulatory complex protein pan1 isoform X2 n=1 Tax=Nilaparvata lugens TaxID=108931 RepID=UPI00193D57CC|nr:actin cytoskeleton-regulatory complex protein pan1 isoform X2 [Nilaparvata lugens]